MERRKPRDQLNLGSSPGLVKAKNEIEKDMRKQLIQMHNNNNNDKTF
jgi:hypothetical protein